MRGVLLALIVSMLASCSGSPYSGWSRTKTAERADIADANARTALGRIADLQDRIDTLQNRVDELEGQLSSVKSETALNTKNIGTLFDNDQQVVDYLNRR